MAPDTAQSAPIVLNGATGYTGRLTAAELAASGADFVLSGRDGAKLEALAAELGGGDRGPSFPVERSWTGH